MPFNTIKDLPKHIKRYSPVIQRQWMHVWNNVFKKTGSEVRAFKAANSILKKRFKRKNSLERNTRHDIFQMMVDDWLGNLKG